MHQHPWIISSGTDFLKTGENSMYRYPHTTAASILLLGSAILLTGAAFVRREIETIALFATSFCFAIGGLSLMWSRELRERTGERPEI